jgi:ribosomal protein L32E
MVATKRSLTSHESNQPLNLLPQTRHLMPNGLKKFLINNEKELELLLMHNKSYAAEIAHGVASRNRIGILARSVAAYH